MTALGRAGLVVFLLAGMHVDSLAQSLKVRVDGERLRVSADGVRFLSGDALRKLHDGVPVSYIFRFAVQTSRSSGVVSRFEYRFVISYDIFEERFQVSRVRPTPRVISHLTAAATEATFNEALEIPLSSLPATRPFWLRLEYEAQDSTQRGEADVSIGGLVEIFSRTGTAEPTRGNVESGPFRLADLPRSAPIRGTGP